LFNNFDASCWVANSGNPTYDFELIAAIERLTHGGADAQHKLD
jgi:hypothetical protein